jgi:hypothetical protein
MYTYRLKNSRKLFFLDGAKVISDGAKVFFSIRIYASEFGGFFARSRVYTQKMTIFYMRIFKFSICTTYRPVFPFLFLMRGGAHAVLAVGDA